MFVSAPAVFYATDGGDSIKSDPSVVNGGVDLPMFRVPLLDVDIDKYVESKVTTSYFKIYPNTD